MGNAVGSAMSVLSCHPPVQCGLLFKKQWIPGLARSPSGPIYRICRCIARPGAAGFQVDQLGLHVGDRLTVVVAGRNAPHKNGF